MIFLSLIAVRQTFYSQYDIGFFNNIKHNLLFLNKRITKQLFMHLMRINNKRTAQIYLPK
jgi:hypothetical protein